MSQISTKSASFEFKVTEAHCDLYRHLNNASCFEILELARWFFLSKFGLSKEAVVSDGFVPVILSVQADFKKEVLSNEMISIETCVEKESSRTFYLHQDLKRADELCVRAKFRHGIMSMKDRKLVVIPENWKPLILS